MVLESYDLPVTCRQGWEEPQIWPLITMLNSASILPIFSSSQICCVLHRLCVDQTSLKAVINLLKNCDAVTTNRKKETVFCLCCIYLNGNNYLEGIKVHQQCLYFPLFLLRSIKHFRLPLL